MLPALKAKLDRPQKPAVGQLEAEIDLCPDLREPLDAALVDECPLASRDGGFIRDGFNAELDALRELARGGKQWIARYQAEEAPADRHPDLRSASTRSSAITSKSPTPTARRSRPSTSASRPSRTPSATSRRS